MPNTLVFLHTAPQHIETFDRLLAEAGTDAPVRHVVEAGLLSEARAGGMSSELAGRIASVVDGVTDAAVLLCTCSTIGAEVEQAARAAGLPVVRVDRAMAEQAVESGSRILLVAALESTLGPTRELLLETAQQRGKRVAIREVVCQGAWPRFERNELSGYNRSIAECVRRSIDDADVVVLAQASMAGAAELCRDLPIPVLSSPRLGLEAAVRMMNDE